ncbi:MAG: hypothetical protein IJ845_06775 [Bacteroidaceae bacterium]|nr:hypothetical protein [Bacteroidaceae bacterium]
MSRDMNTLRSNLYYELTSKQYEGVIYDTIYMDFIDFSNMEYYTQVKRNGGYIIPLLIFNMQRTNFRTILGEYSLTQTFREFLTEAMLAECNSSTSFELIDNKDSIYDTTNRYRLHLKVEHNETHGTLNHTGYLIMLPNINDEVEGEGGKVRPSSTKLSIHATLTCGDETLLDKTYSVTHKQSDTLRGFSSNYEVTATCLDDMTQSLSLATKKIVELISQELNMLTEGRRINVQSPS